MPNICDLHKNTLGKYLQENFGAELGRIKEFDQLSPFTNDRFGERIMRERIKEKAQKGYSKYRLPTGETIGKIEGFQTNDWMIFDDTQPYSATKDNISVGTRVFRDADGAADDWIITDILGDGRFKAVPKETIDMGEDALVEMGYQFPDDAITAIGKDKKLDEFLSQSKETFDLTGKSNPQYRRYEQWGKFLKNKYGGKVVTDPQGNSWVEIDLTKDMGRVPVEAFGVVPLVVPVNNAQID